MIIKKWKIEYKSMTGWRKEEKEWEINEVEAAERRKKKKEEYRIALGHSEFS